MNEVNIYDDMFWWRRDRVLAIILSCLLLMFSDLIIRGLLTIIKTIIMEFYKSTDRNERGSISPLTIKLTDDRWILSIFDVLVWT